MKEIYEVAEMEVVVLNSEDIITSSTCPTETEEFSTVRKIQQNRLRFRGRFYFVKKHIQHCKYLYRRHKHD